MENNQTILNNNNNTLDNKKDEIRVVNLIRRGRMQTKKDRGAFSIEAHFEWVKNRMKLISSKLILKERY